MHFIQSVSLCLWLLTRTWKMYFVQLQYISASVFTRICSSSIVRSEVPASIRFCDLCDLLQKSWWQLMYLTVLTFWSNSYFLVLAVPVVLHLLLMFYFYFLSLSAGSLSSLHALLCVCVCVSHGAALVHFSRLLHKCVSERYIHIVYCVVEYTSHFFEVS